MPANWRLLEDELVYLLRQQGHELDEDHHCDKVLVSVNRRLNVTKLAQSLSEKITYSPSPSAIVGRLTLKRTAEHDR